MHNFKHKNVTSTSISSPSKTVPDVSSAIFFKCRTTRRYLYLPLIRVSNGVRYMSP